jgi:hypothetical protein
MPLTGAFTNVPNGNVVPVIQNNRFEGAFRVGATFVAAAGGTCAPGEYRQYVQGQFTVDGVAAVHVLCGAIVLSTALSQEDGCPPPNNPTTAYGYRVASGPKSLYTPGAATGCTFASEDEPGFGNLPASAGRTLGIDLSFRGVLIDTANPGVPLAQAAWTVRGNVVVPRVQLDARSFTMVNGPAPPVTRVIARTSQSLGFFVVNLSFPHQAGPVPLQLAAFAVTFYDRNGALVLPVQPHSGPLLEVGNQRSVTSTATYAFDASHPPVRASVLVSGRTIDVDL